MADISNVHLSDIKEISDSLEALSCKYFQCSMVPLVLRTDWGSSYHDSHSLLKLRLFCLAQAVWRSFMTVGV
jgi:hypothetical protein